MYWFDDYFLFGLGKCKSRKKLTAHKNNQVFINTFMRLMDIAATAYGERIEVNSNLISKRLVIQSLIAHASVVFFEKQGNILALAGVPSGKGWNIYGDPLSAWVFSRNGLMNEELNLYVPGSDDAEILDRGMGINVRGEKKGFMLFDNKNRYPFIQQIVYYAEAIADTYRTIDVARKWLKMPSIPVCEQSLVDSVNSTLNKMSDNDELIPVSSGMQTIDKFTLLPSGDVTKNITSATALIDWYEQQFRAMCGYKSNAAIDKKGENLISEEVNINEEVAESTDADKWDYMREQTEVMNRYFGSDIITIKDAPDYRMEQESGAEVTAEGGDYVQTDV